MAHSGTPSPELFRFDSSDTSEKTEANMPHGDMSDYVGTYYLSEFETRRPHSLFRSCKEFLMQRNHMYMTRSVKHSGILDVATASSSEDQKLPPFVASRPFSAPSSLALPEKKESGQHTMSLAYLPPSTPM